MFVFCFVVGLDHEDDLPGSGALVGAARTPSRTVAQSQSQSRVPSQSQPHVVSQGQVQSLGNVCDGVLRSFVLCFRFFL